MEGCDCGGQIEFLEFLSPSLSRYICDPLRSFFRDIFFIRSSPIDSVEWNLNQRVKKKHQSTHHLNVNFRRDHKSNSSHRRTNFNSRSEQLLCMKIVSHQDRMEILGRALTVEINWIPCLCFSQFYVSWSSFFLYSFDVDVGKQSLLYVGENAIVWFEIKSVLENAKINCDENFFHRRKKILLKPFLLNYCWKACFKHRIVLAHQL